jgi:V/A-type H+-transporting ATPase subunit A
VRELRELLSQGDSIYQMMQVTGEEGITEEDYVKWQKSVLLDMVFLQQDAFDSVDAAMPRERQLESFSLLKELIDSDFRFKDKDEARTFFTRLTNLYKNWNYSAPDSPDYDRLLKEIGNLADQFRIAVDLDSHQAPEP